MHPCKPISLLLSSCLALAAAPAAAEQPRDAELEALLAAAKVPAGFAVVLEDGRGAWTMRLARQEGFYVQALLGKEAEVQAARIVLTDARLDGGASVELRSAKLPYFDHLVNLILCCGEGGAARDAGALAEIARVLAPGGVVALHEAGADTTKAVQQAGLAPVEGAQAQGWLLAAKPWPEKMDEWSHTRHNATGDAVSRDEVAGPPRQVQWLANPLWGHHRGPEGVVTAGGRIFFVLREKPLNLGSPGRFFLTARDAFNGRFLWQKPVPYQKAAYGYMASCPLHGFVATKDRLFGVPDPSKPAVALDAASGKELKAYDQAPTPEIIAYEDGVLLFATRTTLHALNADTGEVLWQQDGCSFYKRHDWVHSAFVVGAERVCFPLGTERGHAQSFQCRELRSGRQLWSKTCAEIDPNLNTGNLQLACFYKGVLLFTSRNVIAVAPEDGAIRWSSPAIGKVYCLQDKVWTEASRGRWVGLNLADGKQSQEIAHPAKLPEEIKGKRIMDGQCNFPVATERFFVTRTRMSLVEAQTGKLYNSMFTRAPCKYLLAIPANGLLYTFPKDCGCYPCLRGAMAYAPEREPRVDWETVSFELVKGPAYGTPRAAAEASPEDWPMHRCDGTRSAASPTKLPGNLKERWVANVGGKLSGPAVACGHVYVAAVDRHMVVALDAGHGKARWRFTAGGRVDSPPTIHHGLCLFGSRDGWIYALDAAEGTLVWRFRAAPREQRMMAFEQPESPWPVFGTVLAKDGIVYASAGRHANADGGIRLFALEAESGKLLWQNGPDYEIVNDVLKFTPQGNIYLGKYKVAFDARSGKRVKEDAQLQTQYAGLLTSDAGPAWAGADLLAWGPQGSVSIFSGKPNAKGRSANLPGSGYEIGMKAGEGGWSRDHVPVRINALALAANAVAVAGGLDFPFDSEAANPWGFLDGERGARLLLLALDDGKTLSEVELKALPVFDGLAAAQGKLFLSTADGTVHCFGGE